MLKAIDHTYNSNQKHQLISAVECLTVTEVL